MGYFSSDIAQTLAGLPFGLTTYTAPASLEVGLLDEGGFELGNSNSTASYARIASTAADWELGSGTIDQVSGAGVVNSISFIWGPIATGESWEVRFVRIWDDAGAVIATVRLDSTITYEENQSPWIKERSLRLYHSYFDIGC